MATSDLFSSLLIFSIIIIFVLIGCLYAFVSYRMTEQDHKINSMVELVSVMAQESQFVKSKLNNLQNNLHSHNNNKQDETNNYSNELKYSSQMMGGNDLISVSDEDLEEDNSDSEISETSQEDFEEDNDNDEDSQEDEDNDEDNQDDEEEDNHIKLLNLSLANIDVDNDSEIVDLNNDELNMNEIKTIHLEESLPLEETDIQLSLEEHNESKITNEDISFLKNVTITDLGESDDLHTSYKKMSLNKLREVVVHKGIISDASKLKKNEILKMLGDE
jgi:hypothetical protein